MRHDKGRKEIKKKCVPNFDPDFEQERAKNRKYRLCPHFSYFWEEYWSIIVINQDEV